jgi:hypothetical protein
MNTITNQPSIVDLLNIINEATIKEGIENKMIQGKMLAQENALGQVSRRRYIIGSINEAGLFSIAASPVEHLDTKSAQVERERLAKMYPGRAFVTLQFVGASLVRPSTVHTY